jgi:hypothetical protein
MNDVTKDLLEALLNVARMAEKLKKPCGTDPESPQAIRNAQYMNISYAARAAIARAEAALSTPQSDALEQVRAEEREACAKACERERDALNENLQVWQENPMLTPCDEFIADWDSEAKIGEQYAAAIRARGQK